MNDQEVLLRITIREPPAGVRFQVQRGKNELLAPGGTSAREIVFEFPIRVRNDRPDGSPNFLGPFAQGPVGGRFVYVNSGTMAGESVSPWTRRAKIPLGGITWPMIANAAIGGFIEAGIAGTARDGGPACATVPLLDKGWKFSKS
ncbi:MAG TPA: DUF5990 family protein [Thermoanaerobaculia bacterium]|jgi:hypothetical protein|nr:DUF5990 family protein [Thermoanaerobaculia bacterium]